MYAWATHVSGWGIDMTDFYSTNSISDDQTIITLGTRSITQTPLRAYSPTGTSITPSVSGAGRPYVVQFSSQGEPSRFQNTCGAASRGFGGTTLTNGNYVHALNVFTNTSRFSAIYPNGTGALSLETNSGNTTGGNTLIMMCAAATGQGVWALYINAFNTDQKGWRLSNAVSSGFAVCLSSNSTVAPQIVHEGQTTISLPVTGSGYDGYVVMFNNNGVYLWHIHMRGTIGRDDAFGVAIGTDTTYSCGRAAGDLTIWDQVNTEYSYTITASSGFVICTSLTGVINWVARSTGTPRSVSATSGGGVVVVGTFVTSVTFYLINTNTVALTVSGPSSIQSVFASEYSSAGVLLWASRATGNGAVNADISVTGNDGSLYMGGGFQGTSDLSLVLQDGTIAANAAKVDTETGFVARLL
jgi:hypothetical protein